MSSGKTFIDPEGRRIVKIFVMDGEHISGKLDNVFSDNQDVYYDGISNRHQVEIYKGFYDPDGKNIFSSGHIVTYHIDTNNTEEIEIDDGADCIELAPPATKSGWTFVGWRENTSPSADVLRTKACDADGIQLYAVFKRTLTLTMVGGSSTLTSDGIQYYNNDSWAHPGLLAKEATLSGWTLVGYRNDTAANPSVSYVAGTSYQLTESKTIYAVFQQTITVTLVGGSSQVQNTGTRYYNNNHYANPDIKLGTSVLSGWTLLGYRNDKTATNSVGWYAGTTYSFAANTTLYAVFYQNVSLSYNGNGSSSGSTAGETKVRYYNNGNYANPTFTLKSNGYAKSGYTFTKWAMGSAGGTQYSAGANVTLSSSTVFFAVWAQIITNFDYTGGVQSYTVPVTGTYQLEVWGAQGGGIAASQGGAERGGKGGYSKGNVSLTAGQVIYIVVGGKGGSGSGYKLEDSNVWGGAGGYNGGASGGTCHGIDYQERDEYRGGGGGGGATHIGKSNAVLSSTPVGNLFIAAGGGGGSIVDEYESGYMGGSGGGQTGGGYRGGTQSSGGGIGSGYGYGSSRIKAEWQGTEYEFGSLNGGGGGYYGGGGGGWDVTWSASAGSPDGGGGGSGYIGGVSNGSTSNGAREGNGYARITILSA